MESVTLPPQDRIIAPGIIQRYKSGVFAEATGGVAHYRPVRVSWRRIPTGDVRTIEKVTYRDSTSSLSLDDELRIWNRRKQLGFSALILTL